MKKILFVYFILFPFIVQSQQIFKWHGYVYGYDKNFVPFATVQVTSQNRNFIFAANQFGELNFQYDNFNLNDSIAISSIGFRRLKTTIRDIIKVDTIILQLYTYNLGEIIVRPKRVRYLKLGNLNEWAFQSSQISFNAIYAIYIPYSNNGGQIHKIRIFMHDFAEKNWVARPFRLRLFDGSKVVGNELITEELIACIKPNEKHWVEIDISIFNLELPKNGIFVGIQALSTEYYKANGFIKETTIKHGKYSRINSISIGSTKNHKNSLEIQSWTYFNEVTGWTQEFHKGEYPMIQLIIAPK